MRGGMVALGAIFLILGVAWFLPVMFGSAFGLGGALAGFCAWVLLAPIFFILGLVLLIAGAVAESPDDRAPQPVYVPYYPPPPPPQVIYVQGPPPGGSGSAPPPPPRPPDQT